MTASEVSWTASSTSTSPASIAQSFSQIAPPAFTLPKPLHTRQSSRRSLSTLPIPEDAVAGSQLDAAYPLSSEEWHLYDINHEIKSTLTDLLNCDAVRQDEKMRLWVQKRLMDTELELKRQRKRRVSAPSIIVSFDEEEHSSVNV